MQLVVASILIALSSVHGSPLGPKMTKVSSASSFQVRAELTMGPCVDDLNWVDKDGDGCAVYAMHIKNKEFSQSEACDYSDGAAKVYCRATCGLCKQPSGSISATVSNQIDSFASSISDVLTSITSSGSVRGDANPTVRHERVKHTDPEVASLLQSLEAKKPCKDDSDWVDADGDGCAVYADHIAAGSLSQDEACMYGNGDARDHCRVTCGTCIYEAPLPSAPKKTTVPKTESSADGNAPAPIPAPYRAPVSPKMVPAGQVSPPSPAPSQEACMDDPEWTDPDGDSCAVYADKIEAGEFLLEEACNYAKAAAKTHCPATCKTCPPKAEASNVAPSIAKKEACIDDPEWVDQDGDGCIAYATAINVGSITKEEACAFSGGKAKQHCRATCDMCPHTQHVPLRHNILGHTKTKPAGPKMTPQDSNASVVKKGACIDDPDWADQDGDDCAVYAKAIKENQMTQSEACSYSNGNAKRHCLITCNACPRAHSKEQNLLHHPPSTSAKAVQFV